MGECEIEQVNDHCVNATTKMSPSYDLIIEENCLSKPLSYGPPIRKVQSVNGEGRKERLEESFLMKITTKMNQD